MRKEFNSLRTGLGHQHGRRFIVLGHQYGRRDVMWKHSKLEPPEHSRQKQKQARTETQYNVLLLQFSVLFWSEWSK